jgi:hypothetical protein
MKKGLAEDSREPVDVSDFASGVKSEVGFVSSSKLVTVL